MFVAKNHWSLLTSVDSVTETVDNKLVRNTVMVHC